MFTQLIPQLSMIKFLICVKFQFQKNLICVKIALRKILICVMRMYFDHPSKKEVFNETQDLSTIGRLEKQ